MRREVKTDKDRKEKLQTYRNIKRRGVKTEKDRKGLLSKYNNMLCKETLILLMSFIYQIYL
jgi:hypothetical protein